MRTQIISSSKLKGRAYAGTYVVSLAWDFITTALYHRKDLLGFAIERTEFKNNAAAEKYWMKGIKRFKEKDVGLDPGTPVPTSEHPVQSFQWCDYTVRQNRKYEYRIVPVYGKPKLLELREAGALKIPVQTEAEMGGTVAAATNNVRHDLFFNRGVIGSQAYARE